MNREQDISKHMNSSINFTLSATGSILSLSPIGSNDSFCKDAGLWSIILDGLVISQDDCTFTELVSTEFSCSYFFLHLSGLQVILEYLLPRDSIYLKRRISLRNAKGRVLGKVSLPELRTAQASYKPIPYNTFWNCPTVIFWRGSKDGFFVGIENPFFERIDCHGSMELVYEVNMEIDDYDGDYQFIGHYVLSDEYLVEEPPKSRIANLGYPRRTRFRNPSGQVPINTNESWAMQLYLRDYFNPLSADFEVILYCYWFPIPRFPATESDVQVWKRTIDQFVLLSGTTIMTYPLVLPKMPTLDKKSFWELEPAGSAAEEIMTYARSKGLRVGYYMGCAAGNLEYGATAFNFPLDAPISWKKTDIGGDTLGENCIASSEYRRWALQVIGNTIERYEISLWGWDPGPGNALFCCSDSHGHTANGGAYAGWQSSVEMVSELGKKFAGTKFVGFYGTKEFGPWGLRNFYQHEGYFEQQLEFGAGVYPDLSSDRQTANGIRMQAWWSQNFRFLPAEMNHTLVGRLSQYCMDSIELSEPWDRWGWQYSLLSAISVGSSVTLGIIPNEVSAVKGMKEFYEFWIRWAREKQHLLESDRATGSQVRGGSVDVHFRVSGGHGVIFFANPGPRSSAFDFRLTSDYGFQPEYEYRFDIVSSRASEKVIFNGLEKFSYNQEFSLIIPSYAILVLEVNSKLVDGDSRPISTVTFENSLSMTSLSEEVVGIPLDNWWLSNLEKYEFPNQIKQKDLSIRSDLEFNTGRYLQLLNEGSLHSSEKQLRENFQKWQDLGFHDTFVWDATDRVILIVPFSDSDLVGSVRLTLNGQNVKMQHWMLKDPGTGYRFSGEAMPFQLRNMGVIWWADVSPYMKESNSFQLEIDQLDEYQFLGPLLFVPREVANLGQFNNEHQVIYRAPVQDSQGIPLHELEISPGILEVMPPVLTFQVGKVVRCDVRVELPASKIAGVYFSSLVGSGSWGDMPMKCISDYVWSIELHIGRKDEHILESNHAYIWLEDFMGRSSEVKIVDVKWIYSKV